MLPNSFNALKALTFRIALEFASCIIKMYKGVDYVRTYICGIIEVINDVSFHCTIYGPICNVANNLCFHHWISPISIKEFAIRSLNSANRLQ